MMKALKKIPGERAPRLVEVPVPMLKKDEVLVKVYYAGICKTDLKVASGELLCKDGGVVLGHEFSGVVVDKDPKIGDWLAIGTKVVANPMLDDLSDRMLGKDQDGCFAEYVAVPFQNIHEIPAQLNETSSWMKLMAYAEPVAAALGVVDAIMRARKSYLSDNDEIIVAGDPKDRIARLVNFLVSRSFKHCNCQIISPEELLIGMDLGKQSLYKCIIECCPDKAGKLVSCLDAGGTMVLKSRGYVNLSDVFVNDVVMKQLMILGAKYSSFVDALDEIWKHETDLISMISDKDYSLEDFKLAFAEASKPEAKKVMFRCAQ